MRGVWTTTWLAAVTLLGALPGALPALIDDDGNLIKDQGMANAQAVGGAFFLLIGAALIYGGLSGYRRAAATRRHGVRYTGEVIAQEWGNGPDAIAYRRVRWTDRDGVAREALSRTGNTTGSLRPMPYPIEIDVDPAEPDRFEVAHGAQSGVGSGLIFLAGGVVFALVGVVMIGSALAGA